MMLYDLTAPRGLRTTARNTPDPNLFVIETATAISPLVLAANAVLVAGRVVRAIVRSGPSGPPGGPSASQTRWPRDDSVPRATSRRRGVNASQPLSPNGVLAARRSTGVPGAPLATRDTANPREPDNPISVVPSRPAASVGP